MRRYLMMAVVSAAAAMGAFASVPPARDSMALQTDVSEIQTQRQEALGTDSDIKKLSDSQNRYHEDLPLLKKKSDTIRTKQSAPKRPAKKKKVKAAQKDRSGSA